MQIRNLDIDLLRSFAAVADSGSFTAAGEIVARSQSAISVQIKRLEEAVGCKIFERTSRSLALTPAGDTLLGYARRILELNDESFRRMTEPPVTGEIRLGVTEYFVPGELTKILARFAAVYPDVHLEVRMGLSRDLRSALNAGELDAAIVRLAPREHDKAIWREPQQWVARQDFSFKKGEVLPLVVLPPGCILREYAIDALKKAHQPRRIAFTSSSMTGVQAAVMAGLGISIVPRSSVLPGMRVLAKSKLFPEPGHLEIGILRAAEAPQDIVVALEKVVGQTLNLMTVTRPTALGTAEFHGV
jgi:DNA-binding transcriptional LysR family regulator